MNDGKLVMQPETDIGKLLLTLFSVGIVAHPGLAVVGVGMFWLHPQHQGDSNIREMEIKWERA